MVLNDMPEDNKQPPKTVAEIGIHIGYMSEDLKEIKGALSNQPNRKEFEVLEGRVTKLESALNVVKNRIITAAITILVGMILAQYGLNQFFRG